MKFFSLSSAERFTLPIRDARRFTFSARFAAIFVGSAALFAPRVLAQPENAPQTPTAAPLPTATPAPAPLAKPPVITAYVAVKPRIEIIQGRTMVPLSLLSDGLGASTGAVAKNRWRILFFGRSVDVFAYQRGALFGNQTRTLPLAPILRGQTLYVPWQPLADYFGITWRVLAPVKNPNPKIKTPPAAPKMLLQYPAAYVTDVRHSVDTKRARVVIDLSAPTRITATQDGASVRFSFAAARVPGVPAEEKIGDYLVSRGMMSSGNWRANFTLKLNYAAPVRWYTEGNPARLVIDVEKLFEEKNSRAIGGGLSLTQIRKGTTRGPVKMYVVCRVDPQDGWRIRVAPGGYGVLQRARTSHIAARQNAIVGINGGFFAYDGAAVGAVLVNGEWLRLPWRGRTALGFKPDGTARIDNLQASSQVTFSTGLVVPVRDLNGWPDKGTVSAMTRRLGTSYTLRPDEIAAVVVNGVVVSKPGGGLVPIPANGFTLVANGLGARRVLAGVQRGQRASLKTRAIGWEGFTTAIGAGPRLVRNGGIDVTATQENFREDVRLGPGPRTAFGLDKNGRYIICVVDGRQPFRSVGLTLSEMAATMIKLGAVDAINLDGGGSTAMTVKNRVVNSPSDGYERSVSNALLVSR